MFQGKENKRIYFWAVCIGFFVIVGLMLFPGGSSERSPLEKGKSLSAPSVKKELTKTEVSKELTSETRGANDVIFEEPEGVLLPIPQDTRAIARAYAKSGPKDIRDMEVLWQRKTDEYIAFLKEESFSEGLHRTYMKSELGDVLGKAGNYDPDKPESIRIHARTRRFSKLLDYVHKAKASGQTGAVIEKINLMVDRFIEERKEIERKLVKIMEERPELFHPDEVPEENRYKVRDLLVGYGLTSYVVPNGLIPMSLRGTQYGILVSTFLLGVSEDGNAVAALLKISDYDSEPFLQKLRKAAGSKLHINLVLANEWAIADALDRILSAQAETEVDTEARGIAKEYLHWRERKNWPVRKQVEVYPYDAPQTPYNIPGSDTDNIKKVETTSLSLPLEVSRDGGPGLVGEDLETIMEFGRRYNEARK